MVRTTNNKIEQKIISWKELEHIAKIWTLQKPTKQMQKTVREKVRAENNFKSKNNRMINIFEISQTLKIWIFPFAGGSSLGQYVKTIREIVKSVDKNLVKNK